MLKHRGIVIHDTDCGEYWAGRLEKSGIDTLGVHPAGGIDAHLTLAACADFVKTENFLRFRERLNRAGIRVEFEMHALSWLLPRDLFSKHPAWFRADENGERTPRFNCCASNPEALGYLRERTALLASLFPSDTHRYHFWIDDVAEAKCHCPACESLTASDQALILTNAMAEGVRRTDPEGKTAYLAYCETLNVTEHIKPHPAVFLEFAPIARSFTRSLFDPVDEKNAAQVKNLPGLLAFFGSRDAKVLDYWVDNSLFSGWKLPPKKFELNAGVCRADVLGYAERGFESVTSFGCFLGENYRELWGDAPVEEYFRILSEA
ncbi:MAG: DUF4838 domain-containing protein [Clostridia bacterium]|nr:DUF4838 domain-containing protein [Clostridia bacterium]